MRNRKLIFLLYSILVGSILFAGCSSEDIKKAPLSSMECFGKQYEEVVSAFENAGFENIKTAEAPDLILGLFAKEGEVASVSIGGNTTFSAGDWFLKSTEILITYYTHPAAETAPNTETEPPQPSNTLFTQLSDAQFSVLTNAIAKSFYSFTLSQAEQQSLSADSQVMDCLTQVYDYAYANNFELDPDYKAACATRYALIQALPCYETLQKNFLLNLYRDTATSQWVLAMDAYSLDPADVVEIDGSLYIDAEGYLQKGVELYWLEEGKMIAVGKVLDIAYQKEVDGVLYGYAVNVAFYDDPSSSGWTDGEIMLTMSKRFGGKPTYYVGALDENRCIIKEYIDYSNATSWALLDASNCKSGTQVYSGITQAKAFVFTVLDVNANRDTMTVRYPSGSIETKCYSSMLALGYLYVKA